MADPVSEFVAQHARAASQLPGGGAWRDAAIAEVARRGLPDRRDERWRYTRLSRYLRTPFEWRPEAGGEATAESIEAIVEALAPAALVVLDNGRFRPELSRLDGLPEGLGVQSLAAYLSAAGKEGEAGPPQAGGADGESVFELLNTAFVAAGAVIEVAQGAEIERPVVVLHRSGAAMAGAACHNRVVVRAGSAARVALLEFHQYLPAGTEPAAASLATSVTDLILARDARVRHNRLQRDSDRALCFDYLRLDLAPGARLESGIYGFRAGLGRHEVLCRRLAEGAAVDIRALLIAGGRTQQECQVDLHHSAPNATSRLTCKTIVNDAARAVFNGRVLVSPGADGTDARVDNANLLLSADAEVDTKPELEIYADDVACSHGATVGQLDEEQIYYLRSRGLPLPDAQQLLLGAFASELLGGEPDAVLRRLLERTLQAALAPALAGIREEP